MSRIVYCRVIVIVILIYHRYKRTNYIYTCIAIQGEAHIPRQQKFIRQKDDPLSLLHMTAGPKSWWRKMPVYVSAVIGFWTYTNWNYFARLNECYTPLKPVTFFLTPFIDKYT
jgi:hypothetical protein